MGNTINVCAAVLRQKGRILICNRPAGTHMEGYWEFPGGKRHASESDWECLEREITEELSVKISVLDLIRRHSYNYPEKTVNLSFYRCICKDYNMIMPAEGQKCAWISLQQLAQRKLLPADMPLAGFLGMSIKYKNPQI